MICLARPLKAAEAAERGIVAQLAEDYSDLIAKAVAEVHLPAGRTCPGSRNAGQVICRRLKSRTRPWPQASP